MSCFKPLIDLWSGGDSLPAWPLAERRGRESPLFPVNGREAHAQRLLCWGHSESQVQTLSSLCPHFVPWASAELPVPPFPPLLHGVPLGLGLRARQGVSFQEKGNVREGGGWWSGVSGDPPRK